jgi:hypothetical protein
MNRTLRALPIDGNNPATVGGYKVNVDTVVDLDRTTALIAAQFITICMSGTTAQRPQQGDTDVIGPLNAGTLYCDTTLSKIIVWTGAAWRDPFTGGVV